MARLGLFIRGVRTGGFALVALGLAISAAWAAQVRPVNLEEMTARAAVIFAGRCVDVRTVSDPTLGRDVSVATFQVHRVVKGEAGHRISVRMPQMDDGTDVAGVPAFARGDEVVLFLYGESVLGLQSPVGLGQGRFKVALDKRGHPLAQNDVGNRNLLHGLSPVASGRLLRVSTPGGGGEALDPAALLDMAEALAASEP